MQRKLTSATTLDNLRKEAKRWLRALRDNDAEARERLQLAYPKVAGDPVLRDVQLALAREYGLENWKELKLALQKASAKGTQAQNTQTPAESRAHTSEEYQQAGQVVANAYEGDASALQRLNQHYRRSFTLEDLKAEIWRRVYAFRQRAFKGP